MYVLGAMRVAAGSDVDRVCGRRGSLCLEGTRGGEEGVDEVRSKGSFWGGGDEAELDPLELKQ